MTKDASTVTKGINKLVAKSRGGMAGCTTRLGELQAKVSAGIHPSKLLLLILTALDITERPLITVAYILVKLVSSTYCTRDCYPEVTSTPFADSAPAPARPWSLAAACLRDATPVPSY